MDMNKFVERDEILVYSNAVRSSIDFIRVLISKLILAERNRMMENGSERRESYFNAIAGRKLTF